VLLRLTYLAVTNTFSLIRLLPMSEREKEIEILALRHQLTILQHRAAKLAFTPHDRFLAAGLPITCRWARFDDFDCWSARTPSCAGTATS
jgi:hypothetical protein